MKKSTAIILITLIPIAAAALLLFILLRTPSDDDIPAIDTTPEQTSAPAEVTEYTPPQAEIARTDTGGTTTSAEVESITVPESDSAANAAPHTLPMDDALFIGDSRTVGIYEYAEIPGADFFADVGMSVYNIHNGEREVDSVGSVTLTELMEAKKYGKIYIMLGINEVGYYHDVTAQRYGELIDFIKQYQPDAVFFIQANLHVTQKRSDKDDTVNNPAIDSINQKIAALADGVTVHYLDANTLFDDENGALDEIYTEDNAHLYAKNYKLWGEWIVNQSAIILAQN